MALYQVMIPWYGVQKGDVVELAEVPDTIAPNVAPAPKGAEATVVDEAPQPALPTPGRSKSA